VLQQYGEADDGTEEKDYLLVDDNWGWYRHRIETNKLELVQPAVVKSLRKLLIGFRTGRSSLHSAVLAGWSSATMKSSTAYAEKIFRRNFRRSNTREAARRDRDSAISCTRAPGRFSNEAPRSGLSGSNPIVMIAPQRGRSPLREAGPRHSLFATAALLPVGCATTSTLTCATTLIGGCDGISLLGALPPIRGQRES